MDIKFWQLITQLTSLNLVTFANIKRVENLFMRAKIRNKKECGTKSKNVSYLQEFMQREKYIKQALENIIDSVIIYSWNVYFLYLIRLIDLGKMFYIFTREKYQQRTNHSLGFKNMNEIKWTLLRIWIILSIILRKERHFKPNTCKLCGDLIFKNLSRNQYIIKVCCFCYYSNETNKFTFLIIFFIIILF